MRRPIRRRPLLLATVLVAGLGLWLAWPYVFPHRPFRTGSPGWTVSRVIGETRALDEASALGPAHRPGSFWTLDDSLGPDTLFRLDTGPTPRLGLTVETDAVNRDWEDLAAFMVGGHRWLIVADTGNNMSLPRDGRLWLLREPPDGATGTVQASARPVWVRFPGDTPDVESVAADEAGGYLLMVSKRERLPRLFALPLAALAARTSGPVRDEPLLAAELGFVRLPTAHGPGDWPTGLALAADTRTAVVLTYHKAVFWHRRAGENWPQALARRYDEYVVLPFAMERPEGVALAADGRTLFVVGEERPVRLWRWRASLGFRPPHD